MHATLTVLSIRAGYISSALWSSICGTGNTSLPLMVCGVIEKLPYKNAIYFHNSEIHTQKEK
jgi:hypothetical protein